MNAEDVLYFGNRTVMAVLDEVDVEEWDAPGAVGYWTVKNVVAHLASHEWKLVDAMCRMLGEEETGALARSLKDPAGFNDREVESRAALNPQETVADYRQAHQRAMEVIRQVTPGRRRENGALPWYGAGYDLEDYIAYGNYGHKREHIAQIAAFLERLRKDGQVKKA